MIIKQVIIAMYLPCIHVHTVCVYLVIIMAYCEHYTSLIPDILYKMTKSLVTFSVVTYSVMFVFQIASFVNAKVLDTSIQQVSLAILESMVLSSSSLFNEVKLEVTLERLLSHLQV